MRDNVVLKRRAIKARRHNVRGDKGKFAKAPKEIPLPTNGSSPNGQQNGQFLLTSPLTRRTTRATVFNWLLPSVGAITPLYLEMILRGALAGNHVQQYQLFDLMIDSWPELAGCIQELTYGVTRREIIFDPYTEEDEQPSEKAIEKAKLVSALMRKMKPVQAEDENGLKGTVRDLMDGWFRGTVVQEVMWETIDTGRTGVAMGPRATAWVMPMTWGFNQQGVLGYNTATPFMDTSIAQYPVYSAPSQMALEAFPPDKFLVGIHKVKSGSPLGGPMLRVLAWWWCAANFSSDWLLNLAQVFGLPFRWATYSPAAPDATVNAICDMLANMGSAGWGAFPTGTVLELKEPVKNISEAPQSSLLDRADHYARSLILGQTMSGRTMLTSGRGGQAFGTVEAQLKQDRLQAAAEYAADIFNEQLIPSIIRLNYGDEDELPVCRFLQDNEGTFQDAQRDQILVNMGTPIPVSHIRKKYSIPEPEGDEEILAPPVRTPEPTTAAGQPIPLTEKASQGQPITEQQRQRSAAQQAEEPQSAAKETPVARGETPTQKQLAAGLERISKIKDDELFAREFRRLTSALVIAAEKL